MMAGVFYKGVEPIDRMTGTHSGLSSTEAAIELLDEWMSTPDDLGDDWWTKFRAEFQRFRLR